MCGITGIFAFNLVGKVNMINLSAATSALASRGPDVQNGYNDSFVGLGHRRLCIIDTTEASHQPLWDESGRYGIIYNGEIFNYRELRADLENSGFHFFSQGDTEVLLKAYIRDGAKCLDRLNGFFSLCIYDRQTQRLFLARDRYGIKPLLYLMDEDKFIFASEMKSLLQYGIEKEIDYASLLTYFQLNYIPAPYTVFSNVRKLMPGHYLVVESRKLTDHCFYEIPYDPGTSEGRAPSYEEACKQFGGLLEDSVKKRLVSDVPLGAFLSGGVDSSVVCALAARHKPDLQTFSIGYRDEKFFDETVYARLVASKLHTEHTVFSLSNDDLYQHLDGVLNYIDEPFADSSAIAVYILSKETRKHATVALSGDGADELLGGYNKHAAFLRALSPGFGGRMVSALLPLWRLLPRSRNDPFSNRVRQLARFGEGLKLPAKDRYWHWAGFLDQREASHLFRPGLVNEVINAAFIERKNTLLSPISEKESINDILYTDCRMVLPNDMLTKVDLMSMANSLEVRVPFLDYRLVDFLFSLPGSYKIDRTLRKRLLQDTFREILPQELYNRPKKGFEVPLLKWFRGELRNVIETDLLGRNQIEAQGIFHYPAIERIKRRLFSSNPGDIHATVWALVVFQRWWRKTCGVPAS